MLICFGFRISVFGFDPLESLIIAHTLRIAIQEACHHEA